MKKHIKDFVIRGLVCAAGGPLVLAVIYGCMSFNTDIVLTPREVSLGIISATVMAFIAGGINVVYHLERLPLIFAILIHGCVLYTDYLIVYLLNNWLPRNPQGFWTFTGIFVGSFALIWIFIYLHIKSKTERLNRKLSR